MKLYPQILMVIGCLSGCCTGRSRSVVETPSEVKIVASEHEQMVRPSPQKRGIGSITVSGGVLVLDKGTDNGIGSARVVTVCAMVVVKEQTRLVPVATAEVVPSKTTSLLNLRTTNVRDEDGDLVLREFRANPIRYAVAHQLIAVSGAMTSAEGVVSGPEFGMVVNSGSIKE